ncbi:MAG: tetratricopeptide repeat protein [Bacteroides sp.]|nr:tetratricopeptide repeat protein [Ruminococcus flavefaciens]MCM1554167.1 tetratricopeptide repeat protein [Bacteroides sp.]
MKSIVRFFILGALVFAGFGYVSAQSAAGSSRDIVVTNPTSSDQFVPPVNATTDQTDTLPDRGIPTPPIVEQLLQEGRIAQALSEFEKFKAGLKKANPFQLLFLEMTVYEQAHSLDLANATYAAKIKALKQEIIEKFPNEPDTYLLQIDNNTPADQAVELATKAINAAPEYLEAYSQRGRALYKLGKTKEACVDFEKVPWKNMIPEYRNCQDLQ